MEKIKKITKKINGLRSSITVLPGAISFPKFIPKKLRILFRELYHFLYTYFRYKKIKPDVIYIDNANIFTASMLSRLTSTPVVFRVMGVYPSMKKIIDSRKLKHRVFRFFYTSPFSQVICTQDGSGVEPWLDKIIHHNAKTEIMINGVDMPLTSNKTFKEFNKIDKSKMIILFVGKFENSKGCIQFLKAFYKASIKLENKIHALMIGSGSKEKELVELSLNLNLDKHTTFINRLPHEFVFNAHQISDIYVSLNRYGNLSNANLEAMKFGQAMIFLNPKKRITSMLF